MAFQYGKKGIITSSFAAIEKPLTLRKMAIESVAKF
jgi:hypothetical protein